jgi:hypothetical protein
MFSGFVMPDVHVNGPAEAPEQTIAALRVFLPSQNVRL